MVTGSSMATLEGLCQKPELQTSAEGWRRETGRGLGAEADAPVRACAVES